MPERGATVGIVAAGSYLPECYMTAADIARESGMPEQVVREKLGITGKHVARSDDHPNEMAYRAALDCLSKTDIRAAEIDVVLCTTEEWREYLLWTCGIDLAYRLGATRAWAMDLHMRCCTTLAALRLAKEMMAANDRVRTVLIAGGYGISHFIDLTNPRTSFLFNIGAGAGALLLRRDWPHNQVLGTHLMSDGSMSRHVVVPASGTLEHPTDAAVAAGRFKFDLVEPEAMKTRLNEVSMRNWLTCIDRALEMSGRRADGAPLARSDVDFLNLILIKPSAHRELLGHIGLTEDRSVYLGHIGHIGEQDSILAILEGERTGRLREGDLMLMVAAGIGYVWGATCVRWGAA